MLFHQLLILTHFIHPPWLFFLVLCEYMLDRFESSMAFLPIFFNPPWPFEKNTLRAQFTGSCKYEKK